MTIYINGTTGISGVDGSAGTPAVQGTDTNTGVFYPAADTVGLATSGSERMRIDTSGNVGIGTSSPTEKLSVAGNTTSEVYKLRSNTSAPAATDAFIFRPADNTLGFGTNATERMRIDSSGNLLVGGTSSVYAPFTVFKAPSNANFGQICASSLAAGDVGNAGISVSKTDNNTTTSQIFVKFLINGTAAGSGQINANGANACAFGTYSDRRLKENIVDLPSQLDKIMALRTVEFDYIESEGGGHQIGFIAQEVQQVYPDLVGEREDGMLTLTDLNKNDARLIKAIQEMKAIIDTQANTITALTARIEALEAK